MTDVLPQATGTINISPFMCIKGKVGFCIVVGPSYYVSVPSSQTREVRMGGVHILERSMKSEGIDLRCLPLGEVIRIHTPPVDEVIDEFPEQAMTALGFASKDDLRKSGVFYRLIGGNHRNEALRRILLEGKCDYFPKIDMTFPMLEFPSGHSVVTEVLLSEKSNQIKATQVFY